LDQTILPLNFYKANSNSLANSDGVLSLQTVGCATAKLNRQLDEKLAQETSINGRKGIQAEAGQLIKEAPSLTPEQKKDLEILGKSLSSQLDEITKESLKLRSVLVKDVISNYDSREIDLIRDRLQQIEDRRLRLIFSVVRKTNAILGRQSAATDKLTRDFFFDYQMQSF